MAREEYKGTRTDGRGLELCCNCWDGYHTKKTDNGQVFSNCLQGDCQCPCIAVMLESPKKITKRDRKAAMKELQTEISTPTVLVFHKGEPEPTLEKSAQ